MADGHIEIEVELNSDKAEKELDKFTKTIDTGTKQAAKSSENATKQFTKSTESAVKRAEKTVEQSAKQAGKAVETSAKQAGEKASQSTKKSSAEQKQSYKQTEEQAKASAENASKYWESAGNKIKNVESVAAKAAGAALVAGGTAAIKVGIDFEAGMSEVQAISGASGKNLQALTNVAKEMGATTKFSATQSAEALKYMAMAGWKTQQMVSGLPGVMNLAAASGEDLGTVSDIVTDALSAFGLQAKDSAHFADVLAKASSSSNTNVGMMGETFKYVAPVAGAMGYSIEDTAVAIGLMANAGIKASDGGTALRAMLTRLVKPPKEAAAALSKLGISATDSNGKMKPLRDVLLELREKFKGLSESEKAQYAASIAGQEAMSGLLAIVGASDSDFEKLTKSIDNANGAAKKQADTMNNNLKGAMYKLGSAAEAVGIEVYEGIKGPLTDVVKDGATQIRSLASAIQKGGLKSVVPKQTLNTIKNLGTVAKTVAGGGIKVLGASAKVLGSNMSTVLPVATSLLTVFKGYTAAKAAATGVKTLTTAYKALDTMEKANAITLVAQNGGLTALQTVVGVFTGKVSLATAATGAFNAACTALGGPVGVAVLAVGALTAGVAAYALTQDHSATAADKFASSCEKLKKKQDEVADSIKSLKKENKENVESTRVQGVQADNLYRQLTKLMKVEHKSVGTKAQIASVVKQLNELMPDLKLSYDAETDSLNKSTSAIKKNIDALKEQAMAKAYQSGMEKSAKKVAEAEIVNEDAIKKQTKAQEKYNKAKAEYMSLLEQAKSGKISYSDERFTKLGSEITKYEKALKDANKAVKDSNKNLNDANKELTSYTDKFTAQQNYTAYLNQLDDLAKEAGIKASQIPKSVGQGIKDGVYANPTTGDELKQLIKLDNLVNSDELAKMQEAGMKIPEYLSKGIADGSVSFKDAAKQLENGIDWTGMIEKARAKGIDVPNSIAEGILSGQYAVPTSVTAVENLVTFEDLKTKAQSGGIQVPEYLANGITSGSMKPAEAAKALGNLMSFQDAIDKAGLQGAKVPAELATKIAQGKVSVDDAVRQLMSGQGLSVENFGLKTVLDNTAKSTGDAKKKIESNLKINPVDNSSASKSFDSVSSGSKKAANNVKKNTDSIKKNSKIPATDNSGSGTKTYSTYTSSLVKGAGKVKSATASISKSAVSGLNTGSSGFKNAGVKGIGLYVTGIGSKAGAVKTKATSVAKGGVTGAKSQNSGFTTAGAQAMTGMASGINANAFMVSAAASAAASAALSAAKKELEIHSPSRKFRDIIGKNIPKGIARGIKAEQKSVISATKKMIASLEKTAKDPKGKFEETGKNFVEKFETTVNKKKDSSIKSIKNLVDTQVKALKKQNKKQSSNYTKAGKSIVNAYTKAITSETKKLVSKAEKEIEELSKKYQEKYDKIISLRDSLEDKQKDYGNIYDLKQNIADLEQYQKNLKALENKIPDSMMEHILGMDIDSATEYMEWFRSLSKEQQKAYTDNWKKQQSMSESFSKSFFADDISKLNKEYSNAINKATANLEKQMKQIGKNLMKGLASGMKSETKNLNKITKSICNQVIKAAKKAFDTHSPSKEFEKIGKNNMKGTEVGQEKEAKKLYSQMTDIADTMMESMAQRFARARLNIQDIQGQMQSAVASQMARVSANVNPQLVASGGGGTTVIEKTVYTGPEKIELVTTIDGRPIAKGIAPFMNRELEEIAKHQERGG
ncbi:phage tail tape measure protein [Anaerostipes faecalis]|uniref:phage tail tape measure protein n=1 Tax=Anaerostipes faecalis TaxID=2738446 RepID=UPI003F0B3B83